VILERYKQAENEFEDKKKEFFDLKVRRAPIIC